MSELFSRNFPIISEELQQKVEASTLSIIGCGLGSNIASVAARTGFKSFIISDGDEVETSNLNRQQFDSNDLGINKAEALSVHLKKISQLIEIKAIRKYIASEKDIDSAVAKAEVVINTADFSNGFKEITKRACLLNKLVLAPFNVFFGSAVIVFNKENYHLLDTIEGSDKQIFSTLLQMAGDQFSLPLEFEEIFSEMFDGKYSSYTPQINIASNLSSALVVRIILKYLNSENINVFPYVYSISS